MHPIVSKPKNPAAVALAKLRAASQTPERRREIASIAGTARAASQTQERRREVASLAAKARWGRWRKEREEKSVQEDSNVQL